MEGKTESVDYWRKISFKKKVVKKGNLVWNNTSKSLDLVSTVVFLGALNFKCKRTMRLISNNRGD